jgi:hypothetical protein
MEVFPYGSIGTYLRKRTDRQKTEHDRREKTNGSQNKKSEAKALFYVV